MASQSATRGSSQFPVPCRVIMRMNGFASVGRPRRQSSSTPRHRLIQEPRFLLHSKNSMAGRARRRKRRAVSPVAPDLLLAAGILLQTILKRTDASTFFCGTSMEDASTDCHFRKNCPSGTDNECPPSTRCFASQACDTNRGHGKLVEEFPALSRSRYDITNYRYGWMCACVC